MVKRAAACIFKEPGFRKFVEIVGKGRQLNIITTFFFYLTLEFLKLFSSLVVPGIFFYEDISHKCDLMLALCADIVQGLIQTYKPRKRYKKLLKLVSIQLF